MGEAPVTNMEKLIAELTRDEGRELRPYYDTADPPRLTIGVGRNLSDKGITQDECDLMLKNDIKEVIHHIARNPYTKPAWSRVAKGDLVRQRVLLNMGFNMGVRDYSGKAGLASFHNTLQAVAEGRWKDAATGMRKSKWARQVGPGRSGRLIEMMETGREPMA